MDAPLVGILFIAYAYMARYYLPGPYRRGVLWTLAMVLIGALYFALGLGYVAQRLGIL